MVADCNQLLKEIIMMLQFGGRNPRFGVNHVYRCLDYLVLCVLIDVYYFVLCVLMCIFYVPECSRFTSLFCYGVNGCVTLSMSFLNTKKD